MNKNIVIGSLAVVALVFGVLYVATPAKVEVKVPEIQVGAVSGPELYYPSWTVNGVPFWPTRQVMKKATTTPCAIQSPAATSTLQSFGVVLTTSSTTASIVTIAKSATAFATTTAIGTAYAIPADGTATIQASTSPATLAVTVFQPNQWVVVGMQGNPGNYSPVGRCTAVFTEI